MGGLEIGGWWGGGIWVERKGGKRREGRDWRGGGSLMGILSNKSSCGGGGSEGKGREGKASF